MPRRLGPYAPLSASYASDDAIIAAGEKAELLYVRALAFCASSESDGFITDAQLVRFVGAGMRDAARRAAKLVEVGLWERAGGGYIVRGWLKWNASAEELGRQRKKDRDRKAATTEAQVEGSSEARERPESDDDSARNPAGIRLDTVTESGDVSDASRVAARARDSLRFTVEKNPPTPLQGKRGSRRAYDYDQDPDFVRFWTAYPRKVGKPAAFRAWQAAVKRGADPEVLIAAAERYHDDPSRKQDYTKHPGPWLNDERYNDQPDTARDVGGFWNF